MTALATGHSSLTNYVRRCAILTLINSISDVTTLAFMIIFIDKAPIPLLAIVYVSNPLKTIVLLYKTTNHFGLPKSRDTHKLYFFYMEHILFQPL